MSAYRVPSPPAGPPHPRPRRFRPQRTIGSLLSLPLGIAAYMFFAMLVAFAFEIAIHTRFEMPSGEPCLCR